jgi:Xaa-Pro aminopeptidase
MMQSRLASFVAKLPEREVDAILVSGAENRRYLSGFSGSAGYLYITGERAHLATDFRYTEQATSQAAHFNVEQVRVGWDWLLTQLKESGARRVGFESQAMNVATYNSLSKAISEDSDLPGIELVPFSDLTDDLRSFKDSDELVLLQKAIDASDIAMERVCPTIAEGMTEREVAWRMEMAMRDAGADGISFDTIVAAGPNGAMAHHMPTDDVIKRGEPIVIDMGAKVGGYCSDITRTVVVGEPDEMFHKIYNIVLDAQLTAIKDVKIGMNGEEADKLARDVIADAGYGENFGHSLGHGVGLAVHEIPRVSPRSTDPLDVNSVFTVEPGIYLSGWGGVRIEDIVILGETGATPLSKASK